MKHVMLDLETLGTAYDAAIVSIGAAEFDPAGDGIDPLARAFYRTIDIQSSMDAGLSVRGETIKWWMQQSDAARSSTFSGGEAPLGDVLYSFSNYIDSISGHDPRNVAIWGNGATFDNVIIRSAMNACKLPVPWRYATDKCYRTVVNMVPKAQRPPYPEHGTKHNALADAKAQAVYLQMILKVLRAQAG